MNCQEARQLIDRYLDSPEQRGSGEWKKLEAHLASCAACAADLRQLEKTRELLADLPEITPTEMEKETMLSVIQATPFETSASRITERLAGKWRVASAFVAVAACLVFAFILGESKYNQFRNFMPRKSQVAATVRCELPQEYAGGTSLQYSAASTDCTNGYARRGDTIASAEQSTDSTRAMWGLVRSGDVKAKDFICPSSGDQIDSDATTSLNTLSDRRQAAAREMNPVATVEDLTGEGRRDLAFGLPLEAIVTENCCGLSSPSNERFGKTAMSRGRGGTSGSNESYNDYVTTGEEPSAGASFNTVATGYSYNANAFGRTDKTISAGIVDYGYANPAKAVGDGDDVLSVQSVNRGVEVVAANDSNSEEISNNIEKITELDSGETGAEALEDSFVLMRERPTEVLWRRTSLVPNDRYGGFAASGRKAEKLESSESTRTRTIESPALKIIKTGNIALEVDSYKAALEQANRVVEQFGATIADGSTREESGGALSGRVVIRVLPERFEELFNALKQIGRVQSENAKAADVTAEYVDTSARIKSLQITETRLRELIKNKSFVDGMKALLEVEREMNRVRTEIEQLQGNLRVMSDRIAHSTIALDMREPKRIVPSADLAVGIWDLEETVKEMDTLLEAVDGQLASGNISKSDNGALTGNYLLKVKLSQFGKTIESISQLGRVDKKVVKDWQAKDAGRDWANRVICNISLVLQESVGQLPSGSINIEVPDVRPAIESLTDLLGKHRGSIAENNISKREDGSEIANLNLQVPAGDFSEVVKNLNELGRITAKTISGDAGEIRGGAANTLCGLTLLISEPFRQLPAGYIVILAEDYKKSLDALTGIIKKNELDVLGTSSNQSSDGTWKGQFRLGIKAAEIDAVIKQLLEIGPVTSQQLQGVGLGNLSRADTSAVAALNLVIAQKQAITPGPERTGGSVRQWLNDGLSALYTSIGLITYGLVVIAPWLILTIVVTWLLAKLLRRGKNRKTAAKKA